MISVARSIFPNVCAHTGKIDSVALNSSSFVCKYQYNLSLRQRVCVTGLCNVNVSASVICWSSYTMEIHTIYYIPLIFEMLLCQRRRMVDFLHTTTKATRTKTTYNVSYLLHTYVQWIVVYCVSHEPKFKEWNVWQNVWRVRCRWKSNKSHKYFKLNWIEWNWMEIASEYGCKSGRLFIGQILKFIFYTNIKTSFSAASAHGTAQHELV